jgi:hypothetical protein
MDPMTVYHDLKAYLIDTPGFTWIEAFDTTEDGCGAYLAWEAHYNGQGELSKCMALAKTQLDHFYYKSKQSMSFEHYSGKLKCIFQVLDKDPDERLSNQQQVEHLLRGICTDDVELKGAKAVVSSQHANDFDAACAYFSWEVSQLHGLAQLEAARCRTKKHGIYATDTGGHGCG